MPDIIRYLVDGGVPTEALVEQITEFGREALQFALKDDVFIEALWLLVRLPQTAATSTTTTAGSEIDINKDAIASVSDILFQYDSAVEQAQRRLHQDNTDLGEIARRAGLTALGDGIQSNLPSLWQPSAEDVQLSLAGLKGTEKFADMAQNFYANFVNRVIHYYVDRNLHNMVGPERVARSVHDLESFDHAIRRHCSESALIMRAFARDWLGKNHYRDGKAISRADVRAFSAHAVEKIRTELDIRKGKS
ncbi:hypothetical protein LCL97_10935 [Seohaeicola saemankumensis]|nr:hypothetical protein [Seohaeicola saemankumensis]MCA0871342.1 hypothetical protein [Seohaeicola saemankumensis]